MDQLAFIPAATEPGRPAPPTPVLDPRGWSALRHGGCLIAPSRLDEHFPQPPAQINANLAERLRRAVTALRSDADNDHLNELLDVVLHSVLELEPEGWQKGAALGSEWSVRLMTGETVRPRRLWQVGNSMLLPVFIAGDAAGRDRGRTSERLGIGRGRRPVARIMEWLRKLPDVHVALLTNGRQWRLLHAGADYDAWVEWDTDFWFEEGRPGAQLTALRLLLGRRALVPAGEKADPPLLAAIRATRRGQTELSATLGENVRRAVELLIIGSHRSLEALQADPARRVENQTIYSAAMRLVMRMVVVLFAEARGDLLPVAEEPYQSSYSLQHLREQLERHGGSHTRERLRRSSWAWPRLCALFRLLYLGGNTRLSIRAYGGRLFEPGRPDADDPVLRALSAFEDVIKNNISDALIAEILGLLTRARIKVRQGRAGRWTVTPVDFSQLDTEYIGILYEGLLDYELRKVEGLPVVFLELGDQPALPLGTLEAMTDKQLASLVEKFKVKGGGPSAGDDDAGEDADEEDAEADAAEEAAEEEVEEAETEADAPADAPEDSTTEVLATDERRELNERALRWARRAVEAGNLAPRPRGKLTPERRREHEAHIDKTAHSLILRLVLPGEYYLVRWGGTRKGAGTFYTKPQLAGPTVRRTLEPLCFDIPNGDSPAATRKTPKAPAEILALKVCDPACGSGSFLIAALRMLGGDPRQNLTGVLYESLLGHGWLVEQEDGRVQWGNPDPPIPDWFVRFLEDVPGINAPAALDDTVQPRELIQARLRRVIVERCIYGVDIDPLAVELARVALWIETMDRNLPFSFLDHKIKPGNALVGCWFDRFQDYPAMAWEREGGDKTHTTGVHFQKEAWTKAINKVKQEQVKPQLADLIARMSSARRGELPGLFPAADAERIHRHLVEAYEKIHQPARLDSIDEQERQYGELVRDDANVGRLRRAFDAWCAVWFWPADRLDVAPTPERFYNPPPETRAIIDQLAARYRFFHWELEFPDVFSIHCPADGPGPGSGFDAILGNPPWETLQPNSKEFFSNKDPLYRAYGKQEALAHQRHYFSERPEVEREWLDYIAAFKAMANWYKVAAFPYGDASDDQGGKFGLARGRANLELHDHWRRIRSARSGFADPGHPYRHQGEGKPYTYKMFLELGHALLRRGGRIGLIVPSGICTDRGSTELRTLFLSKCCWEWLFGFENRDKIFDIDSRFKFCPLIIEKGGSTESIRAAFMQHDVADWTREDPPVLHYPRKQVEQFSPGSHAILEIQTDLDLAILKKMYANSVRLGNDGPDGWGVRYQQGDFNMTSDSKLFPPRPKWEAEGYHPDQYGHWLKGNWRPAAQPIDPHRPHMPELGTIYSRDGRHCISAGEIEDVALPLYQGVIIGSLLDNAAQYVDGAGHRAHWTPASRPGGPIACQFLMSLAKGRETKMHSSLMKLVFRALARNTDTRTTIATLVNQVPCGNSLGLLVPKMGTSASPTWGGLYTSLTYDWQLRQRIAAANINSFYLMESCWPRIKNVTNGQIGLITCQLAFPSAKYALYWGQAIVEGLQILRWRRLWAVTPHERLRLRCVLDAVVAQLYGLNEEDFRWILRDCDHPVEQVTNKAFSRGLDPKGFWRVDKAQPPELRHSVLAQIAFAELRGLIGAHGEEEGLRRFLGTPGGDDGWMLPGRLRLADYGLGHDARAHAPQPVAELLGPRFHDWQLTQSPEESWEECRRHAENIRQIRQVGRPAEAGDATTLATPHNPPPHGPYQGELFGPEQEELF